MDIVGGYYGEFVIPVSIHQWNLELNLEINKFKTSKSW